MILLKALTKATKSIHLVMFGLTDASILQTLYKKSKEMDVNIFYDPSASTKIGIGKGKLKPHPIFSKGLMHQKILVIDDEISFLGSANMTRSSLKMHDNLVIGFHSPIVAKFLKEKAPNSSGHLKTTVGGQKVELWLLPDPRGHALTALREMIRKANYSIRIGMFTLSHPLLVEELLQAQKRGIDLTIAIDFNSGFGASKQAIEKLKSNGAKVILSTSSKLLHHKFLYVDENTLVCGSANWTKAAFYKNHDCFAVLHNMTSQQKRFMEELWEKIEEDSNNVVYLR